jgi:hypothetical protein
MPDGHLQDHGIEQPADVRHGGGPVPLTPRRQPIRQTFAMPDTSPLKRAGTPVPGRPARFGPARTAAVGRGNGSAWALEHDLATGLRLAVALAPWWFLSGRLTGQCSLLREATALGAPSDDAWCAAQFWLGTAEVFSGDLVGALGRFTAIQDHRGPAAVPSAG